MTPDRRSIAARRFGTGLPQPDDAPGDPAAMLAALAGPDRAAGRWQAPDGAAWLPLMASLPGLRKARRTDAAAEAEYRAVFKQGQAMGLARARATLARALGSPDGFRERLAMFWANHFTVVAQGPQNSGLAGALAEDAIRPHLAGRFADLLEAATTHPQMLLYLDQAGSIGPNSIMGQRRDKGLNENLARELIELHTLGVGAPYGQDDVRQLAELLTGLTFSAKNGVRFDRRLAEPGAETVLGVSYEGEGMEPIRAALGALAAHPATAAHLSRKLVVHFVSDTPDPDHVAAVEAAWRGSDGDLMAVYAALLDHPAAWEAVQDKARQPWDFMVAALKALEVGPDWVMTVPERLLRRRVLGPLQAMGQPFRSPRGPDGWPEEAAAWITPQGLAARIGWAMTMPAQLADPLPDPVALAGRALGGQAGERLLWAAARAESLRDGVGLVLASPEFNRR